MRKWVLVRALLLASLAMPTSMVTAASESDPSVLSLEDLTRIKSLRDAEISPDGKKVAFTRSNPRKVYVDDDGSSWTELFVADLKGDTRPFITGKVNISSIQWSADNKKVYFLSKRGDDKFTSLYAIPVDGGEAQKVVEHGNSIAGYALARDGKSMIFWAKDKRDKHKEKLAKKGFKAEVYEEDRESTKLWLLPLHDKTQDATPLYSDTHVIQAKFSSNNTVLVKQAPTSLIDDSYMQSGLVNISLDGKVLAKVEHVGKLGQFEASPKGDKVAIIGTNDIHDPATGRLFVADLKTGKLTNILPDFDGHVRDIQWLSKSTIGFVAHQGTGSFWASKKATDTTPKYKVLSKDDSIVNKASVDADGDNAVFLIHKPSHPTELYTAGKRKRFKRLTDSNPWLADKTLARQESIKYTARDGVEVEGILVHPLNNQGNAPLIVYVHGGPESHLSNGWVSRYSSPVHYAASKGYAAFFPNYRGSTGRGVEFSQMGQGKYAAGEFDDIVDGKEYLVKTGLVDRSKVGITGGSYGGYASAWGATALTEHYAASVMFVGISNQLSKFGTTDIPNEMYNVHARSWPWEKWQWMLERSPIYHVEKAKTPILIMHGKNDTRVHPSQSMELYRYLKTLGKVPVRLVFYPGEGHGNRKTGAQLDYSIRLMRWMDNYLLGDGEEMPAYEVDHASNLEAKSEQKDKK